MVRNEERNLRGILIKNCEERVSRYGKPPEERTIEELLELGIINLDKPVGPSSHEVTAWLKRILRVEKIAHAGTLEAPGGAGEILRFQECSLSL